MERAFVRAMERLREGLYDEAGAESLMAPVLVEWHDSYGCSASWQPLDMIEPAALVYRSVG